ncbi:hypothetical protein SCYAM73S_08311 [Streptomyces cyaneofuscatus]
MTTERSPQRADGWTAAVRQRLGLGRLLPLGGAVDGAWIAETAAASVLRGAAVEGAVLGTLRIGPAREATGVDTGAETGRSAGAGGPAGAGVVAETGLALPPAPPSGLPPGPLRIEAEFRAAGDRPLPDLGGRPARGARHGGRSPARPGDRGGGSAGDGIARRRCARSGDGPGRRTLPAGPGPGREDGYEGGGACGRGGWRGPRCRLADPRPRRVRCTPPRTTSGSRWRRPGTTGPSMWPGRCARRCRRPRRTGCRCRCWSPTWSRHPVIPVSAR